MKTNKFINKLFARIGGIALAITTAIGFGVAKSREVTPVGAEVVTRLALNTASTTIASSNSYNNYGETNTAYHWAVTCGSKQSDGLWLGANNNQKSKMTLGNGSYSDASGIATACGVTTSSTYYAAIIQREGTIANVDKVSLTYSTPGGTAPSEAWVLFNTGSSWSVFQKVTSLSPSGTDFEHSNVASARYAFVIHSTGYCQFKVPVLTFKGTESNVSVSSVSVAPASVILGVGATQQLTPTVLPDNATDKSVSYSSDATNVATVSDTGLITAVSAGNATITVSTTDGGYTATCDVTVTAPTNVTGVTLNKNQTSIEYGSTETLVATIAPADASNKSINWTSSNNNVATVSNGVVTAAGVGEATITATTVDGGFTASCVVTVTIPDPVTFDATVDSGTSPLNKSGVTFTCSSGILNNGSEYRLYKNSTTTFTSSSLRIGKIEFTCTSDNPASGFGSQAGWTTNGNNGTWMGEALSVSFVASGAQVRATSIVITYVSNEPSVDVSPTSVELKTNQLEGVMITATTHNIDTPTFDWNKNNNNITLTATENENEIIVKPNVLVNSSAKVILTVGGADPELDPVEIDVTISEPEPGETAGTAFTVAQASAAIAASDVDLESVYIRGKISQIDEVSVSNHNATYWISDDGTTTGHFQIYRGKYLDNANFTSEEQISLGDTVVVYGTISKAHSNLNQGNYIVSLTPAPKVNSIVFTPSSVTVEPGDVGDIVDLFTNIVINQDDGSNKTVNDIEWSSEDGDIFYVADGEYLVAGDHRSSTTLYASINGRVRGSATINVIDPSISTIDYDTLSWERLTSITVGDQVVFVGEKDSVKKELTGIDGFGAVEDYTTNPSGTFLLTVVAGSANSSYAFKTSENTYLSWADGNTLSVSDTLNDASSWTIASNSNGNFKLANVGTTERKLQFNSGSPRFACYTSNQSTFEIYKKVVGVGHVDLLSLSTIETAYEDENGAYIRLGMSLSESDWNAIDSAVGISGYGVMLLREATLEGAGFNSIEEVYRSDSGSKPTLKDLSKASETAPQDYAIAAKINITNDSNRGVVFCAATYVISESGDVYFVNEVRGSLVDLL